jgi:predicted PurR-regulated permease PerM
MGQVNDRLTNTLLALLVLFGSITFLREAQTVIVPLLVALLLSYLTYPLVERLTSIKVPTAIAIVVVLLLTVGVLGGMALVIRETVSSFIENYGQYEARVQELWQAAVTKLHIHDSQLQGLGQDANRWIRDLATNTIGSVVNFMTQFLLVMFYLIFLLLGHHIVPQKLRRAFTPERGEEIARILNEVEMQVLRYIGLKTALALAVGAITWAILAYFEVNFALLWGIVAFSFYYIPTVGSIVASLPPVALAFIEHGPWTMVYVLVCLATAQSLIGNLAEPRVMGKGLDLDPLLQLVALVFFGWMWGVIGAVLSVPLMVVVKIACAHIEALKPIAIMMGMGTLPEGTTRAYPDS